MPPAGAFDLALDALRRHILAHNLKPGDALPPVADLARACGVSIATMREALRAWEAMGVIDIRHGVGAFLRPYDYRAFVANLSFIALLAPDYEKNILSLWEILEIGCLERKGTPWPEETLQILDALVKDIKANEQGLAAEYHFHLQLCHATGNPLAEALFRLLWLAWREACQRGNIPLVDSVLRYRIHSLIVDALREGNLPKAKNAVRRYFAALAHSQEQDSPKAEETFR